ncbi:MAG: hypothetical protein E7580_07000 [Ruminococcaceae bacterium]|nr:hypothetical protein [Oscillospiraceae bacterium]
MKEWVWALILLSLCGKLAKNLFPHGEKSPLHAPLRFLLSLCLSLVIFAPWFGAKRIELLSGRLFSFEEESTIDGDRIVLEQIGQTMKKSVDTAFPNCKYSLEIYTDENDLPAQVKVICDDEKDAEKISAFIQRNYGLKADAK